MDLHGLQALRRGRARQLLPHEAGLQGLSALRARATAAGEDHERLSEAHPLQLLPRGALRGVRVALLLEALPEHDALHVLRAEVRQRHAGAEAEGQAGEAF